MAAGHFDVDADAVRQKRQPPGEGLVGAGDSLDVDISPKAVLLPENLQHPQHPLRGVVGVPHHAGGKKQPLDIIAAVELDGKVRQLLGSEGGAGHVVGAAVDAVSAVIDTVVGHQHL